MPLVDVVVLVATSLDLREGAGAGVLDALAAVDIGFSLAFGHQMISRLDVRAAHRWAGGPAALRVPRSGRPAVRYA